MDHDIEQVVDLTDPASNGIENMSLAEARERVLTGEPEKIRGIDGSFALAACSGQTVRLARSLDRPMRYFLAKREAGPALVVSDRIDAIHDWLKANGLAEQFHPSYTRMVPAHHVVEIRLVGCPDPDPVYKRFFNPKQNTQSADLETIGRRYIGVLLDEIARWLRRVPERDPIGICFSGGIDSGAVFLGAYHAFKTMGLNLGRLKAFTLSFGEGPDLEQARQFLGRLGLELFLEPIEVELGAIEMEETIRIVEDYKPLDIEAASMMLTLCRGIRKRYPDWKYLIDGDGGDENLKDYPIEENPELTVRSVVHNPMLYHEGWGVGRMKHSLTYSGGLSRSYTRTYGPHRSCGFAGFSPFTRPRVIEVAEGIPFIAMTGYEADRLYALKGDVVRAGIKVVTGLEMPVFSERRFQHGALPKEKLRQRLPEKEADYRKTFAAIYG